MAARIVIRHLAGSKVNQVEQFPADAAAELTIGREPGVEIQFDPLRDDAVSRRHAKIAIEPGDPPRFRMTDLDSRNGTFLNGERIVGETEVLPGDTIELGAGGPKFEFDMQPRPSNLVGRTRAIPAAVGATRVIDNAQSEMTAAVPVPTVSMLSVEALPKPGIGRNTLLHELSIQRQATRQIVIYALIGVLVVIGAVGGILYHAHQKSIAEQNARIEEKAELEAQNAKAAEQNVALVNEKIEEENAKILQQSNVMGMTPQEIVSKFGDATVWIRVHWRLYDRETGRPLFHKTISVKYKDGHSELLPAYVRWRGKLVRWLTLEDDGHTNYPVGDCNCEVSGSGFVVDPQGLILTNKHIAAGWLINYNRFSYYEKGRGVVYDELDRQATASAKEKVMRELSAPSHVFDVSSRSNDFKGLIGWLPEEGGPIFANLLPLVIDNNPHAFEGRNDELSVRFPGTRVDISARLVRASTDNDVALIKIDALQSLVMDTLASDDNVNTGEPVVVLGYPGASIENNAIFNTVEGSEVHHHKEVVPEPTVTPGVISVKGAPLTSEGSVTVVGNLGDAYQMTAPAGAGNSGGPVFNREGKVIGLYTWGSSSHEAQTFAVPIKYARTLMQLQRTN
jgi:serine protease Do